MKLLPFYLCLLAILPQATFVSTLSGDENAAPSNKVTSLRDDKSHSEKKRAIGKLAWRKKLPSTDLSTDLSKTPAKAVLGYPNNTAYPHIVSTHNWILNEKSPTIAVDNARLYVIAKSLGVRGLNHSLSKINEDESRLVEFDGPRWFEEHEWLHSSQDGRSISFGYMYTESTGRGMPRWVTNWLTQDSKSEHGGLRRITLDVGYTTSGILSRDGQALYSRSYGRDPITRAYEVREEAGKGLVAFMRFEIKGAIRAISGKGNRIMTERTGGHLDIHNVDKDTSKLVCQMDAPFWLYTCALNEDGSEAAFVSNENFFTAEDGVLRIMKVDAAIGSNVDQSAIVTVKIPKSVGRIDKLVYDDKGNLHVLHDGVKISLIDPLTREFILLEAPQEGQSVISVAISPNAEYIAILRKGERRDGGFGYQTIVKRKL